MWGANYILLENGGGNVLLENDIGLDAFPDKILLEIDDTGAIANTEATEPSSNWQNICQFSGFQALPGELVRSAYGELCLPKYAEGRHDQELVRVRAEQLPGSPRNEAPDVFITDEITIDDL